jgi:hypothetical protein
MLRLIPWDIWTAAALAAAIVLVAIFDATPAIFVGVFLAFCAYMVVDIFDGTLT